ncbi:MAG: superoxide dismutase family protein [Sphingomonadales bacterium]|nr:superoxide dismutase family protein [Sphingomonadales bacterium]
MKPIALASFAAPLVLLAACNPPQDETVANEVDANETALNEASAPGATPLATALLANADGDARGSADVTESAGGLTVAIAAAGLKPGRYGVHVHATGACTAPDFKSAGGHWNPDDREHGLDNPKGAHSGDLPNLVVGSDGEGEISYEIVGARGAAEGGLLDGDGAAVVIHAGPDDLMTDPSGNSGDRIACGVLAAPADG